MDTLVLNVLLKRLEDRASECAILQQKHDALAKEVDYLRDIVSAQARIIENRTSGEPNGTTDKDSTAPRG